MENLKIYYAEGTERRGPYTMDEFESFRLPAHTLVWYPGLTEWTPASQAPKTAHLYEEAPAVPQAAPVVNNYNEEPEIEQYEYYDEDERPNTYLAWAIVCAAIFCTPLAIPGIVFAARVNHLWNDGRYEDAYNSSHKAKVFCIWSTVLGGIFWLLYFIFYIGVFTLASL